MANGDTQMTPKSYPMTGGDDARSYSQNSVFQKLLVDASKQMINEAITNDLELNNKCFDTCDKLQIADLAGSVGPNTFFAVENIIEAIEQKYQNGKGTSPILEFQVFFNDHASNDFNTLFKTLPPSRTYFSAGVPGSFYDCLFKNLLFILFTPQILSIGCQKFHKKFWIAIHLPGIKTVFCSGLSKEVVDAYSAQFKNDFERFLSARSQELVSGGLMVILVSSTPDGVLMSQTPFGMLFDSFGSCLNEMVSLGLISEEKVKSFNFPMYFPLRKDIKESIKKNGCFSIKRIEILNSPMDRMPYSGQFLSSLFRAFTEGVVAEHFGDVEEIYGYYAQKLEQKLQNLLVSNKMHKTIDLFILLKRNTY